MHIAVVVDLTRSEDRDSLIAATERLAEILDRRPYAPVSFLLPDHAFEVLTPDDPAVATVARRAEFVRSALGSPDPSVLPYPLLERVMQREVDGAGRLGFSGDVLLTNRPWPPHLLPVLRRNGIVGLVFPDSAVSTAGVLSYLDAVLPVIPWTDSVPTGAGDDLAAVRVDLDDLEAIFEAIPTGCATTPSRYLAEHVTVGRAVIEDSPDPHDADLDLLRRKTIRLATRVPERTADDVLDRLARVASTLATPPSPDRRRTVLLQAHRELIAARRSIDITRRRGDDWAKATRLDWDADGTEDLHIELPQLSLVLDVGEGGTILVLDDKHSTRPLGTLIDGPIGHLVRHEPLDSEMVDTGHLTVERLEESRDHTSAGFDGTVANGRVTCELTLDGLTMRLGYRIDDVAMGRFGPELALALPEPRLRVDGGDWRDVTDEPLVVEGHRFRFSGSDDRMVLVSTLTPAEAFVRSTSGGMVVWLHWVTPGKGSYEVKIDLDA